MTTRRSALVLAVVSLVAAGCGGGGSDSTAKERIAACLDKQPDATQSDCKGWEKDGKLADDGTHEDHESMS